MTERLTGASTVDADLMTFVRERDMTADEQARVHLGITDEELHAHISSGNLTAVVVEGTTYVARDQVRALTVTLAEQRTSAVVTLFAPMRALLRAYLDERAVVLTYDAAMALDRPLVCAPRGRGRHERAADYDTAVLPGHSVALPVAALTRYAAEHRVHDEQDRLPIGPALVSRLVTLEGVAERGHVTPAGDPEPRRSRRVYSWVEIDTAVWDVRVFGEVRAELRRLYGEPQ